MMVPQRNTECDADGTDLTDKKIRRTSDNQHLKNIFFLINLKKSLRKDAETQNPGYE